jgi:hypothetical protein
MNKNTISTLALLAGAILFGAVNANAQGCPSGQREMGRCIAGPKPPAGSVKPPQGAVRAAKG